MQEKGVWRRTLVHNTIKPMQLSSLPGLENGSKLALCGQPPARVLLLLRPAPRALPIGAQPRMQRRGPAQALPADLDSSSSRPVVVVIVGLTAVLGRDVMSDGGSGPRTIPEMTAEVVRHAR